ncbi:MAG: HEAT repeat domain-containing protein [Planctomycetota bacterium]|jgi:HEAT repeat protein
MKRKTSAILLAAALLGTGATALLIGLAAGDDDAGRTRTGSQAPASERPSGADASPGNPGGRPQGPDGIVRSGRAEAARFERTARAPDRIPHDSEETRRMRLEASGRVVEILEKLTSTENRTERWELSRELKDLLRTLGDQASPAVRQRLLEMLQTVEPRWRPLIGDALGSLRGDVDTAKALVDMLRGDPKNAYTRNAIYTALGMMRVSEIAPRLLDMIGQNHPDEAKIVETLGKIGGPEEIKALFDRLDGPLLPNTRREIEKVLQAKHQHPGLMDKVARSMEKADAETRRSLLRILGASKNPAHAKAVRELLKTETDSRTRQAAIEALGRFGDRESGELLLDLIQRGEPDDQRKAVRALHQIKDPKTVNLLAGRWEALDQEGRVAVMGAGARLAMPGEKLNQLARESGIHDDRMRVRTAAAQLLGRRGQDGNVGALVNYLDRTKHPSEINTALTALSRIHTQKAAEEAIRALRTVSMNARQKDAWMQRFEKILDQTRRAPARRRAGTGGK